MKCFEILLTVVLLTHVSFSFPMPFYEDESTLKLVHVLYRHGDRTPDVTSLYPSSPYYNESVYYPYGYGQLTNQGKRTEYHMGAALKKRYANFLGKVWNINLLDVRSTNFNRTKMSAQLMLAGLWPPSSLNLWKPFVDWQPIPYNYELAATDKELSPFFACTRFKRLVDETLASPEISNYISVRYNKTLNILAEKTGSKVSFYQAFLLYFGFLVQDQMHMPLAEWTKQIYPEPLQSLAVDYYYVQTNNTELRKSIAGYFLKKLIADTQNKIDNTINPLDRKMFVYSAHETNIATLLLALEAFKITSVPPYGSYVLFEIHEIDGVHGIKLFYQDYTHNEPQLLKIPGCAHFCPFGEFINLVEEILPTSEAECYDISKDINDL